MLATALIAAVLASPGAYAGTVSGVPIHFQVTKAHKVKALRAGRLVARCSNGRTRGVSVTRMPARWSVSARRGTYRSLYHWTERTARGTMTFTATFPRRGRARGTLRLTFTHLPSGARCDTGRRRFTAKLPRRAPTTWRKFPGKTADGSLLSIAMTTGGTAVRPARMQAKMACSTGGTVTLDIRNPTGPNAAVTDTATFRGAWKFVPPAIPGHPAPSGGGVELSGRVTGTGLEGAARMSIGFVDGTSCDGGWTLFSIAGNTAAG